MLKAVKGIKGNILSMLTVFKHLFKKPVTLEYPEKQRDPGENFRGKPVVENCVGCSCCVRVCPSGAIRMTKEEFIIDLKKCIFCGNCSYYCPKGAIKMSGEYELASQSREDLELKYCLTKKEDKNERN